MRCFGVFVHASCCGVMEVVGGGNARGMSERTHVLDSEELLHTLGHSSAQLQATQVEGVEMRVNHSLEHIVQAQTALHFVGHTD